MPTLNQLVKNPRVKKKKSLRKLALKGCPQKKAVCIKVYTVSPKKPNSAVRKVAKVLLTSTKRKLIVAVPGIGHNLTEHSVVLVRGGRVRDIPGVRYKLIRGVFDFVGPEVIYRTRRRSKFGVKKK